MEHKNAQTWPNSSAVPNLLAGTDARCAAMISSSLPRVESGCRGSRVHIIRPAREERAFYVIPYNSPLLRDLTFALCRTCRSTLAAQRQRACKRSRRNAVTSSSRTASPVNWYTTDCSGPGWFHSNLDILQRVVQGMSQVEGARNIRWRNDD